MIDKIRIATLTHKIIALIEAEHFTEIESEIIKQRYLSTTKTVDVRRLSRRFHKPMKYIKRDYQRAERKLYNLLKDEIS